MWQSPMPAAPNISAAYAPPAQAQPILRLQRSIGNAAVHRLLQLKPQQAGPIIQRQPASHEDPRARERSRPEYVEFLDSSFTNAVGGSLLGNVEWQFVREGLRGVVEEARHQPPERFDRIQARFTELNESPRAQWEYFKGLLTGIGEGLWDSVKGIWDLLTLGPRLQIQAMQWLLSNGPGMVRNFDRYRAEVMEIEESLGRVLAGAYASYQNFLNNPVEGLLAVRSILDQLLQASLEKARAAGHSVAASVFNFLELPWEQFGEKIGYVYGMVLFEVLLAVATEGIANGLKWVGSLLAKGGRLVAAEALRLFRLLEETAAHFWSMLKSLGRFALELFKDVAEALGLLFKRVETLCKSVAEGMQAMAEAAMPERGLAGGGGMRIPENTLLSEAASGGGRGVRTTTTTVADLKPPPTPASPPVKRLPPGPEPPPQYTRPSERPGRRSEMEDLEDLFGESQETSAVKESNVTGAGMARQPRHHVFPQEFRKSYFEERGFPDIDDFCVELDEAAHQAIHGGGDYRLGRTWGGEWNQNIMGVLEAEEKRLGKKLTRDEIIKIGEMLMEAYKIKRPFVPYAR
jgi:hypothetical protein